MILFPLSIAIISLCLQVQLMAYLCEMCPEYLAENTLNSTLRRLFPTSNGTDIYLMDIWIERSKNNQGNLNAIIY